MLLIIAASVVGPWANFYTIVGSSAGALTGLQFVVMTLLAESGHASGMQEIRAFGTPTVIHFSAALVISAVVTAPWRSMAHLAICLGVLAAAGLLYGIRVVWHARRTTGYKPDAEDWLWFVALPLVTYAVLTAAAIELIWRPEWCLFAIAAACLAFLFLGIRNAWDTVTYIVVARHKRDRVADNRQ